ncbi:transcriptional regulator, TetR family [Oceanobacillus limi]|uniref:Transcriptional regulator, TetR family n=1 Tax=Oceanobacillus limi TaxID=930131 RepID=A0A1I0EN65_9BACI|nr:TetR/AcrR family transcriptional regulator [Oceanobacillus limi]SET46857.1 transcriptional regulator, TetR family [Oceanobacillus limi]
MAKGFTDQEKKQITDQLIREGKRLFSTYGVKKTSIGQLTKAVGIAQGSFYQFFSSKEVLFFEILEIEEAAIKQKLMDEFDLQNITKQSFKEMLLYSLELIEEHPIVKSLFYQEDVEQIIRKLPPEVIEEHIKRDEDVLDPFIQLWQTKGILVNKDPQVITGTVRAFFTMLLHKKEIGEDVYPMVVDLLAESLAEGLISEEDDL